MRIEEEKGGQYEGAYREVDGSAADAAGRRIYQKTEGKEGYMHWCDKTGQKWWGAGNSFPENDCRTHVHSDWNQGSGVTPASRELEFICPDDANYGVHARIYHRGGFTTGTPTDGVTVTCSACGCGSFTLSGGPAKNEWDRLVHGGHVGPFSQIFNADVAFEVYDETNIDGVHVPSYKQGSGDNAIYFRPCKESNGKYRWHVNLNRDNCHSNVLMISSYDASPTCPYRVDGDWGFWGKNSGKANSWKTLANGLQVNCGASSA
jgi:hypothetical protein